MLERRNAGFIQAALPQHSAVKLCLTVRSYLDNPWRLRLQIEAQPQFIYQATGRKG